METGFLQHWILLEEIPIPHDVIPVLVQGEQPYVAFRTIRDSAVFTSKRLIVRDVQGISGKKMAVYSLPYSAITMWSTENAGRIDFSAEVDLWTLVGHIKISLGRNIDVRRIDSLLSNCILANH